MAARRVAYLVKNKKAAGQTLASVHPGVRFPDRQLCLGARHWTPISWPEGFAISKAGTVPIFGSLKIVV
jgi:hypothetical protein